MKSRWSTFDSNPAMSRLYLIRIHPYIPSIHPSIHPMLHGLSARIGVHCPFNSSLGEFQAIGTASGILEYRPCWCPSPFPSPSVSRCFSIRSPSPAIEFHSCFFFTIDVSVSDLYLMYSVDPSLTHILGEFPGLGLALVHIYKNSDWMLLNRNSSYLLTSQLTLLFSKSYPDSSSSPYLPPRLNSKHHPP